MDQKHAGNRIRRKKIVSIQKSYSVDSKFRKERTKRVEESADDTDNDDYPELATELRDGTEQNGAEYGTESHQERSPPEIVGNYDDRVAQENISPFAEENGKSGIEEQNKQHTDESNLRNPVKGEKFIL